MGLEFGNKTQPAQRPTTLVLNSDMGSEGGRTVVNSTTAQSGSTRLVKKKRLAAEARVKKFQDIYETTGETLGEGSSGHVTAYRNKMTNREFAVKVIQKSTRKSRQRVLKEIEIFHHCHGHANILQLVEYYEEDDKFFLVFEKMEGGTLLDCILLRGQLTEREASLIVRDIASGLNFLHKKGIAHRDLKPENILCVTAGQLTPVKICDFDLGSEVQLSEGRHCSPITTPELLSPVGSADFMAPEVVDVWQYMAESYDKRCDLWSLGIILYILLSGHRPFHAHCSDDDCGFDDGETCENCQELLFRSIQQGVYTFPHAQWSDVSDDAKDLIQHLLVKDPHQRYTAQQVLQHVWITSVASTALQTPLATPYVLSRNNSVRELSMFAETANAVNRLIQRHMSINNTHTPTTSTVAALQQVSETEGRQEKLSKPEVNHDVIGWTTTSPLERAMFHLGLSDDDDDDICIDAISDDDEFPVPEELTSWLSSPGGSNLAKRRQALQLQHSQSSVDSGTGVSPPSN